MIDALIINEVMTKYLSREAREPYRVLVNISVRWFWLCFDKPDDNQANSRTYMYYNYAAARCMRVRVLLTLRIHVQSKRTRVYTDIGFTLNCTPTCGEI